MDQSVSFLWNSKCCHATIEAHLDDQHPYICAYLKEDALVQKFGSSLQIPLPQNQSFDPASNEEKQLKEIILQSCFHIPMVEKMQLPGMSTDVLREKMKRLENDYASRFGGLNNHKMLADIWLRIKHIKEELAQRHDSAR